MIKEGKEMPSEGESGPLAVLAPSPLFRAGLVALLSAMGFAPIEEAADLNELRGRAKGNQRPKILLVSLPQKDEYLATLTEEIKAWAPDGKVVFIARTFDLHSLSACFAASAA